MKFSSAPRGSFEEAPVLQVELTIGGIQNLHISLDLRPDLADDYRLSKLFQSPSIGAFGLVVWSWVGTGLLTSTIVAGAGSWREGGF